MGCWNETCMVSHLPIRDEDRIQVILLLQAEGAGIVPPGGMSYPSDLYRPLFLPFEATYNGYGSVDDEGMGWHMQYILAQCQRWMEQGILTVGDPTEADIQTAGHLVTAVRRSGMIFHQSGTNAAPWKPHDLSHLSVGCAFILQDIFDRIVAFKEENSAEYVVLRLIDHIQEMRKNVLDIDRLRRKNPTVNAFKNAYSYIDAFGGSREQHFAYEHYLSAIQAGLIGVENYLDGMGAMVYLNWGLSHLRRAWMPQVGMGSQNEMLPLHRAIAEAILVHSASEQEE